MRSVSFSFDTEADHEEFTQYAREKGMTLSALAKMALYQYRAKYPHKGIRKSKNGIGYENEPIVQKTVRPHEPTVSGDIGADRNGPWSGEWKVKSTERIDP